jgi:hypothetical protein
LTDKEKRKTIGYVTSELPKRTKALDGSDYFGLAQSITHASKQGDQIGRFFAQLGDFFLWAVF